MAVRALIKSFCHTRSNNEIDARDTILESEPTKWRNQLRVPISTELHRLFYDNNMTADCLKFVLRCSPKL